MIRSRRKLLSLLAVMVMMTAGPGLVSRAVAGPPGWVTAGGGMSDYPHQTGYGETVTLPDGRVLIMGGISLSTSQTYLSNSAVAFSDAVDVYDSTTRSWLAPAAPMPYPSLSFAASVLHDGRVLVGGGLVIYSGYTAITRQAFIYNPASNTWTQVAPMPVVSLGAAAVTLNDGRVLVVGDGVTQLYDPSTNTWTLGPSLSTPRDDGTATLLANGTVLVSGGQNSVSSQPLRITDLYHPSTNSWSSAGQTSTGHLDGGISLLPDGRVIAAGGFTSVTTYSSASGSTRQPSNPTANVDIYDPSTNQWHEAAPMSTPRGDFGAGVIADGTFVVAGGTDGEVFPLSSNLASPWLNTAEAYDPSTNQWASIPSMPRGVGDAPFAVVRGQLLIAGGLWTSSPPAAFDMFNSEGFVYSGPNQPPVAVASVPATVTGFAGGTVAVPVSAAGSSDPDYDPLTFVWSEGGTTLATTTDPTRTATVPLSVGTHVLTLTVNDGYGGVATTTAKVTVLDASAALQAQIPPLTTALQQAQTQLGVAEAAITNAVGQVQTRLRTLFRDASFLVPGGDSATQLGAVTQAVVKLRRECQRDLYRLLKPPVRRRHRDGDHDDHDHRGRGRH